jgi:hypothetical protein
MSVLLSITGCVSGADMQGSSVSLTSNEETFESFVKLALTPESYIEYEKALIEQEKRTHYIDIEEQYHEALLNFHKHFTEAYNLGIIDENGVPTGIVNADFDSFVVEKYGKNDLINEAKRYESKEALLQWLKEQRWITEGAELDDIDNQYLDIMLSEYNVAPGEVIGFTSESLSNATVNDILVWLSKFYDVEKRNVNYYRESVSRMTDEELNNKVNELLTINYEHPVTDKYISVIDNRHVLTENTLKNLITVNSKINVNIYNNTYEIDVDSLGKKPVYGDDYFCQVNDDGTVMTLKLQVDGKDETFNLSIDENSNKINVSVYDIYRLLGMKVYV